MTPILHAGARGCNSAATGRQRVRVKMPNRQSLARLAKFGVVGLSGVGVNHGLLLLGLYVLDAWEPAAAYAAALTAAIGISILTNFLLNDAWTWRDRRLHGPRAFLVRLGKYYLVAGAAGVVQWAISWSLSIPLEVNVHLANLTGIAAGVGINFFVNHLWTFRKPAA